MKVVPQAFYQHPNIEKVLVDGLSAVILKKVSQADLQNERYLAAHALTYVRNGSLQVEAVDGQLLRVPKNHFVFIPKGLYMISDIIPQDEFFEAMVFFFDETLTDTFLERFDPDVDKASGELLLIPHNDDLRLFADNLSALYRGKNHHQFTTPKLLELLHLLSLSPQGEDFVNRLKALKKRNKKSLKAFMDEHYDKPLDIKDYAYLTGRSISTFQRDFKRRFHSSPKQWLIEKRLRKAASLLRHSTLSVNEVKLAVGYENISHFIKAFHKKYGSSPKQFQLQYRKNMFI
ncbi:helix-turn-helix domain-containing protein [Poritiphilus flavus]|uniref:Helix-turn-helix domain-containing protein n=1 Tax=Poritiphilus flavus TaxID=2697053 RepID=A0A6L9EDM6_9FLAO|nr:AraC family transcriptional regulator [Poritiphilus flavus]NAS12790.1 helix-turn-helix domain-containing protein [Poritiphilus flavus]